MPFNEYECQNCGAIFDLLSFSFEDKRELRCPKCGSEELKPVDVSESCECMDCGGCEVEATRESS